MSVRLHHGDCLSVLPTLPAASIDSIVTDPPSGIGFMNKGWDHDRGGRDHWITWMQGVAAECLRVCKPGGHALVWALPRTSHWTATAWENAGWEVRDRVSHLFATGFPKNLDIGKAIDRMAGAEREVIGPAPYTRGRATQSYTATRRVSYDYPPQPLTAPATDAARQWDGWGSALKPACEDWWLLRKPLDNGLSIAANVLKHGVGGLNIGACRVPAHGERTGSNGAVGLTTERGWNANTMSRSVCREQSTEQGRWPANICHDGSPEVEDAFAAFRTSQTGKRSERSRERDVPGTNWLSANHKSQEYTDSGSASRFFFCAKASKADRCDSKHPTVKSLALMRYLCQLITPPGGTILDPFAGSGTTGQAALDTGCDAILIEREAEYCDDIRHRLLLFLDHESVPICEAAGDVSGPGGHHPLHRVSRPD